MDWAILSRSSIAECPSGSGPLILMLQRVAMGSYTVVDLLSFYKINDQVRLNLDVKNLFDRDYEEGAFGNVYAYPGAPRTVQVGISYTL